MYRSPSGFIFWIINFNQIKNRKPCPLFDFHCMNFVLMISQSRGFQFSHNIILILCSDYYHILSSFIYIQRKTKTYDMYRYVQFPTRCRATIHFLINHFDLIFVIFFLIPPNFYNLQIETSDRNFRPFYILYSLIKTDSKKINHLLYNTIIMITQRTQHIRITNLLANL